MNERSIAVHSAISALLWPIGFALVLLGLFTEFEFGQLGIVLCMVAATLTVRGYFCGLYRREREAFELGRDYAAGDSGPNVRTLR